MGLNKQNGGLIRTMSFAFNVTLQIGFELTRARISTK